MNFHIDMSLYLFLVHSLSDCLHSSLLSLLSGTLPLSHSTHFCFHVTCISLPSLNSLPFPLDHFLTSYSPLRTFMSYLYMLLHPQT